MGRTTKVLDATTRGGCIHSLRPIVGRGYRAPTARPRPSTDHHGRARVEVAGRDLPSTVMPERTGEALEEVVTGRTQPELFNLRDRALGNARRKGQGGLAEARRPSFVFKSGDVWHIG